MRLSVQKTLKMYVNGKFIRSESGRVASHPAVDGGTVNVASASRKDLRDAIGVNRGALSGWTGRTAYNRGQILYRVAEMLEGRRSALPTTSEDIDQAIDRAVHYAGWTDKITAILSTLNPVANAYVNYSMVRSLGVVVALPHARDGLTGLIEAMCVPLVMSNTVTVLVPYERAELSTAFSEVLHTSDVPSGVINLLTGNVEEVLAVAAKHDDIDGVYLARGAVSDECLMSLRFENARVMRRLLQVEGASRPATPNEMVNLAEVKTVWMSARGVIPAGSAAY